MMDIMINKESEDNESETLGGYLVIRTKKDKLRLFCILYWRILIIIGTALAFSPLAFLGKNSAYPCFYIFILTSTYWIFDVMHPAVTSMIPVALITLFGFYFQDFLGELHVHNGVLNCLGVMMMIVAIEYSNIHRRIALVLLRIFGCSHYRLSFMLFFTCMFLSMWMTSTMACGLMLPIVKAILFELEKMGILEVYHNISKYHKEHSRHEQSKSKPTDFTIFYFLGLAYSSSIGGMATMIGSANNGIFRYFSEIVFPNAPKLEFPQYMLLNLPGVILMETLLYLWMNFYFMGLFRAQSEIALEIGMTEEEAEYMQTLLSTQYPQLGRISFHESVVAVIIALTIILHATRTGLNNHVSLSSPIICCVTLFFFIPINLDFFKFFKKRSGADESPYPTASSKACLNWSLVRDNVHWTVIFIQAGSCTIFEALRMSRMMDEVDKVLVLMKDWPGPLLVLAVILLAKLLTEFASNACVMIALMPNIIKLSILSKVNPHYLMSAANLGSSVPFHLMSGSANNALVAEYVHIHPWKMMQAGVGPSVIAVCVIFVTVTLWSRTIWPDVSVYPAWANQRTSNLELNNELLYQINYLYST